ncbi:h/aca ribonucleoprotein complex non-core subunit naf1 [Anaeramoeba flamelloides]|uniref:H/ACA ribonucleoprotein complex non-core subunit NAF1 n=1 Tax=Anaeramoeba flamelloides TaxID=1746091 RepID=A0ABQ8XTU7_9EUKA|nr:h/aca ribonucleoprotein complex non-core subunit naf1 [Anaeramoeba flamelloides]
MNNPNSTLNESETNKQFQDQSMVIDESNSESNHSDEQSDKEKEEEEEEEKSLHNLQTNNKNMSKIKEIKKIGTIQTEVGSSSSLTSLSSYSDLEEIGKTKSNSECVEDKNNTTLQEEESENTIKPITIPTKELENINLDYLGNIISCINYSVIVRSAHGILPLKIGSIIFLKDRTTIGRVCELFGPVVEPCYLIKIPRNKNVDQSIFSPNKQAFYCPEFAHYLGTDDLDYSKPSDASKENDIEIPIEEQEFSDDEKERQNKRKKKNLRRRKRLQKKSQNSKIGRKIQTIPIIVNKKTNNNMTNNNRNTNTQNTMNTNNNRNMNNMNNTNINNMNLMNNNTNSNQIFPNRNNNFQYYQQPLNQPIIQNQFQNQNNFQNFNYNTQTEQPIIPNYGLSRNNQNFQYNTQNNPQNVQFRNYVPPNLQQQQQQQQNQQPQQQNQQQNMYVSRNTSFVFRNPPQNKK